MDRAQEGVVPGLERVMATLHRQPARRCVAELLRHSRYEVLPLDGVEEKVLAARPARRDAHRDRLADEGARAEPRPHVDASSCHGYEVVPHLSARLVRDADHLAELVARLRESGVRDVFVVAGDAEEPAGGFHGAIDLLRGARRARPAVPRGRHHRLPGEPPVHRRRDDDRGDVREGAARDVHHEPGLLRLRRHRAVDRERLGARAHSSRSTSASPAS